MVNLWRRGLALAAVALILGGTSYVIAANSLWASTSGDPILTNSLVEKAASQTTVQGQPGVSITYNNTLSQSVSATIYISVQDSGGSTVLWSLAFSPISAAHEATFFFGLAGLASGSYTARIFATDSHGIPLSNTTTVQVTL